MIQAIVTDIEGTTSSLSFVKEVLFPYARTHIANFIREHAHEPAIADILENARQLSGAQLDNEQLIQQFQNWIERDEKITPLKTLQGLIWENGYQRGDFTGHVYADAVEQLQSFKQQGLNLYVYSSGSIHAQKLLFAHSDFGDLTTLFSGYFDTTTGGKKETTSYARIATAIALPAANILFLSDIVEELDAAAQAGFQTYWLVRGHTPDVSASHRQIGSFAEIQL